MQLTLDQYHAVLRRDFYSFAQRSFMELSPSTEFAANWHIEVIAQELERCRLGETKRLIVNLPPRSLKSHCGSVAFVAWLLGHNPSAQIICASYAQDLADKHAIDCRALMNSDFYCRLFPSTRLSSEKRAVADFQTTARGCRKATSVGGVLTGRGADFIIIDDPLQPDKALSDTRRKAVNDWYDNTLCSRLNHKLTGCIVIIMQRLHEDDLVGHVLDVERRMCEDLARRSRFASDASAGSIEPSEARCESPRLQSGEGGPLVRREEAPPSHSGFGALAPESGPDSYRGTTCERSEGWEPPDSSGGRRTFSPPGQELASLSSGFGALAPGLSPSAKAPKENKENDEDAFSRSAEALLPPHECGDSHREPSRTIEPKWKLLRFPAIAEEDEHFEVMRLGQTTIYGRRQGEVLHPEREPMEVLEQLRETQGEYTFAGQYQQSPAPLGGGLVKLRWFKTYTEAELPEKFDIIFQSWDTANKASELSDYSVCTTWGVIDTRRNHRVSTDRVTPAGSGTWGSNAGRLYLRDVYRARLEYPELKRAVRAHAALWDAKNVLIEDQASGTQLCQELIQSGMHSIKKCQSRMDKVMRMLSVTPTIENGFVYLPERAPWLAQYVHELVTFPHAKHDDQADSTSQALDWIKNHLFEPAIITYYRELAEKAKQEVPDTPQRLTREWYYKHYGVKPIF